jgi:hypothetical protein
VSWFDFNQGTRNFLLLQKSGSEAYSVCYSMGTRWGSCLGVRQLRQEADYSLPDTNLRIHHIPSLHADGQLSCLFSLLHDKEIIYGYYINFPTRIDYSNVIKLFNAENEILHLEILFNAENETLHLEILSYSNFIRYLTVLVKSHLSCHPQNPTLTLCRSYLNPYCLGRKTAFF